MLIVNSRKTSLQTKEKVSESFSPEYFLPFFQGTFFPKTWVERKWPKRSCAQQGCWSKACCYPVQLHSNGSLRASRKFPNLVWCFNATSSRGSRGLVFQMCACGDAMLTSDVKVSTTSLRKTFVSWATEPRRPDQRIMFRTLRGFTLSEITKEVCKSFAVFFPLKTFSEHKISTQPFLGNFRNLRNCVTSPPLLPWVESPSIWMSSLPRRTSSLAYLECYANNCFFFQFLSVPILSCLRRLARKSKWAKEEKQPVANTGFTRLYPRGLFWLLVTWKLKVNSSVYQFTSSTEK